jgi:hypothetical protein
MIMPPRAAHGSTVRLAFAFAIAAALLSGCASTVAKKSAKAASEPAAAKWKAKDCQPAGSHGSTSYLLCVQPNDDQHGTFLRVEGGRKTTLPLEPPGPTRSGSMAGSVGHWAWAALSPDGSRFLAQWSAECEVPIAFFVSLEGGKPVSVSGESDWTASPNTEGFGWTSDGRAIVFIPTKPACGSGIFRPGIYLVGRDCLQKLIWRGNEPPPKLERSLEPRTIGQLRKILGPNAS